MPEEPQPFDVALSFAAEDRSIAREIAEALRHRGVNVFFDEYDVDLMWGKDLHRHLSNIYERSRFVVLLVSEAYSKKSWARFETRTALARAGDDPSSQVLPVALDDSISGFAPTIGYVDLRQVGVKRVVELILAKLRIGAQLPIPEPGPVRVHVIPSEGQWIVKESGASAGEVLPSREAAIAAAQRMAMTHAAEIVIHDRDGKIETRESIGERD